MTEHIKVKIDPVRFDELVHGGSLPEGGDLEIVGKLGATQEGRAAVVISFTTPAGRAQAVTPLRLLETAVATLRALAGNDAVGLS